MEKYIYKTANTFFKELFGTKVYKLALDGGMTCPNRDGTKGTGGCIFCSAGGSGDFAQKPCGDISLQLQEAKKLLLSKISPSTRFIAYFQSYTNTYAPIQKLERLFYPAINDPSVVGLSIGTRPDCLPPEVIALLKDLNKIKPVFVELGLQTIHQPIARLIKRGYPLEVYDRAVKELTEAGIRVITHMILGLPGENIEMMEQTAEYIGRNGSHGIKLQLLHVLKETELEKMYQAGEFQTFSFEEYAEALCRCIKKLPPHMVIHRITGDAPKKLLISPLWSGNKKKVLADIRRTLDRNHIILQ